MQQAIFKTAAWEETGSGKTWSVLSLLREAGAQTSLLQSLPAIAVQSHAVSPRKVCEGPGPAKIPVLNGDPSPTVGFSHVCPL